MRASQVQRLMTSAAAVAVVLAMLFACIECGVIETNETGDLIGIVCRQRLGNCQYGCGPHEIRLADADLDCANDRDCSEYLGVKIYPIERQCAMVGGICVHKTDCAEGTSTSGLCPRSRSLGVECCYSVISQPTTCANLQGSCMNWCNPDLVQDQATDCAPEQRCCTLVG